MKEARDTIDTLVNEWNRERPELDASAMHLVGRILKLGKMLEKKAGTALAEYGIHYTDLDVLATLRRSGFPYELSPKDLMNSVLITSGAMTALLERLTKLDLIIRVSDENDGRVKKAKLTPKGKELMDKCIEVRFNEANLSIECFTESEKNELKALLKKMIRFIG